MDLNKLPETGNIVNKFLVSLVLASTSISVVNAGTLDNLNKVDSSFPESAYSLKEVSVEGMNNVNIYNWDKASNTLKVTHNELSLKQTEFGHKAISDSIESFTLNYPDAVSSKYNYDVKYYVDNSRKASGRHTIDLAGADLNKDFIKNSSTNDGGALNNSNGSSIGALNGDFVSNSSTKNGGAIFNSKNSQIQNITGNFINNSADKYGGAIYNSGDASIGIITGDFINNSSVNHGGAIFNNNASIDKIVANFIGNSSNTNGGAIFNGDSTVNSITGDFINNSSKHGGAIYNKNATINSITGDFIANSSSENGGVIYNNNGKIQSITGDFINNNANSYGGVLYNTNNSVIDSITGNYIDNKAVSNGGAIFNYQNSQIKNITGNFINNSSGKYGGAIYNGYKASIGTIKGNFVKNSVTNNGGAICNSEATIDKIVANFVDNSTKGYGGAIYNTTGAVIDGITGDFINNKAVNKGGAIFNYNGAKINNITGNFTNNSSESSGGAISNLSNIGNIQGNFQNNQAGSGGAICNTTGAVIDSITGDFIANSSSRDGGAILNAGNIISIQGDFQNNQAGSGGGAIWNLSNIGNIQGNFQNNQSNFDAGAISNLSNIGNIQGNFQNNQSNSDGGAILNAGNIISIQGDFQNNQAGSGGGAIWNAGDASIGIIAGNFINNSSESFGGAIYNDATIGNIQGNFQNNQAGSGGAIWNFGNIGSIQGTFVGNNSQYGGAIYNNAIIGEIINSSFINNSATLNSTEKQVSAGAIYSSNVINITSDNYNSVFSGNKTIINGVTENNALGMYGIYRTSDNKFYDVINNKFVDNNTAVLNLNAKNNGSFVFNDTIRGGAIDYDKYKSSNLYTPVEKPETAFDLNINGDKSGKVIFNNDVINANISLNNTNLYLGKDNVLNQSQALNLNSGNLSMVNGTAGMLNIPTLTLKGNNSLNLDVDLANKTMDSISANNVNIVDGGKLSINSLNILSDSIDDKTNILFTSNPILAGATEYIGNNSLAYTPIYRYNVNYDPAEGMFQFNRFGAGSGNPSDCFNPAVLSSSVATQVGGYTSQLISYNYGFNHSDMFMNLSKHDRLSIVKSGQVAINDTENYSPLLAKNNYQGVWVKPYASFENIPLHNGPEVSNINYGTLIGFDSDIQEMKNGIQRVVTGYVGYTGSSQTFSGIDAYQNGGLLGGTLTFYKDNFFNATTASTGAIVGDATSMYGSENFTMLSAGIANKTGYNIEFKEGKVILQPSITASYTFVNTFDYTNASGVKIDSSPFHGIQLSPGLKLIGNTKSGWQPYIAVNMMWNILNGANVRANNVELPQMSIKPYVQYGLGVQKRFKDEFTGYAQAMVRNGGRNGVALSFGFRWNIGKSRL